MKIYIHGSLALGALSWEKQTPQVAGIVGKRYNNESNNLSKQKQLCYWESVTVRNITNETNKTNEH